MPDAANPQKLRGSLPNEEPGSRGIEHMARNPECLRLTALTVAGINPATASGQLLGMPVREGLSPFAIRRGERFEEALFNDGCKRIFQLYTGKGRLDEKDSDWQDVAELFPGIDPDSMAKRRQHSEDLILARRRGEDTPQLIIKPRLAVDLMGQSRPVEPDALVAAPGDRFYRVVEIKSYADRRSLTDLIKTGSACRQASVGLLAMRQLLGQEGPQDCIIDLIFAKPGSNWPTLSQMDVSEEIANLESTLNEAPNKLIQIIELLDGRQLDSKEALLSIPSSLCSGCSDHCPLWDACRGQAIESNSVALLGDSAQELLTGTKDLADAWKMQSTGKADNKANNLLASMLHEADKAYREATE